MLCWHLGVGTKGEQTGVFGVLVAAGKRLLRFIIPMRGISFLFKSFEECIGVLPDAVLMIKEVICNYYPGERAELISLLQALAWYFYNMTGYGKSTLTQELYSIYDFHFTSCIRYRRCIQGENTGARRSVKFF